MSLPTKTFLLLVIVVLVSIIPVTLYSITASKSLASLGTDTAIDNALDSSITLAVSADAKNIATLALKKYRQGTVLRETIVSQVVLFSIAYAAILILVVILAGYLFISRITRPLKELTAAARLIAHDKLTYRIAPVKGNEIGTLVDAFNTMADNLATARQEKIMAERRATWQRVARIIAHEIKNPLTPIKLSTERMYEKFISESKDFPAVIKSTTTTILSEIANLQKLVDSFHTYAKFPDPVLKQHNIIPMITEVIDLFKGELPSPSLTVIEPVPDFNFDASQLRGALTNLIKNSLEAIAESKRENGFVSISVSSDKTSIHISVADNGMGITLENQARLFQPYFSTKKNGNGIGLAFTERIISLHEGSISCASTPTIGTTFSLSFPIKA